MPTARSLVVEPGEPGWYQCVCRCVRRAFLCGDGYEHRRHWIRRRLFDLAELFEIDVAAYAVMSNHYHVVVYVAPNRVAKLDNREVARRWLTLFPGRWAADPTPPHEDQVRELATDQERVALIRSRLTDLSWFMRCLNEWLARRANDEDGCTGRFWEGRFKCRRLLDTAARLASCVYTDLNPIRAGLAETPERSDYTSVQERIVRRRHAGSSGDAAGRLLPIEGDPGAPDRPGVAGMTLESYLQLVDATGRIARPGKRGAIPAHLASILHRLEIDEEAWRREMAADAATRLFGTAVGNTAQRTAEAIRRGTRWITRVLDVYAPGGSPPPEP